MLAFCIADASLRELGVAQFLDNDLYSNFESLLIQLGVKECLIQIDSTGKRRRIEQVCEQSQIVCGCAVFWEERRRILWKGRRGRSETAYSAMQMV